MARKDLSRYALRYGVLAGVPSGALLLALAAWQGVPVLLASFALTMVTLLLVPVLVGVGDAGIEAASAGAETGFMDGSDAGKYQPSGVSMPDRLAVVCWLSGVGVAGVAGIVAFS